jgi:hypothetical protein
VVGIDGLKIEPLPRELSGVDADGARVPFEPVRDVDGLHETLDERVHGRLRRRGRVRHHRALGQELPQADPPACSSARADVRACTAACASAARSTLDDAWRLGFDHVALAHRARARPTMLDMPNGLSRAACAPASRLPDGAAAHRRRQDGLASPTCSCACRWW